MLIRDFFRLMSVKTALRPFRHQNNPSITLNTCYYSPTHVFVQRLSPYRSSTMRFVLNLVQLNTCICDCVFVMQRVLLEVWICVVGHEFASTSPTFVKSRDSHPAEQRLACPKTESVLHFWGQENIDIFCAILFSSWCCCSPFNPCSLHFESFFFEKLSSRIESAGLLHKSDGVIVVVCLPTPMEGMG